MLTSPPLFPNFRTLRLEDCRLVSEFVNRFPPYSDFNAVSLFTWAVNDSVEFSFLRNNLIVRLRNYNTKQLTYSILGDDEIGETIQKVSEVCRTTHFELVPEAVVDALDRTVISNFSIVADRDEDDNMYTLRDLVELDGPGYRKFRRSLSNFQSKTNIQPRFSKLQSLDEPTISQMLRLARQWRTIRQREFSDASFEYYAIRRAIRHAPQLPIDIWGMFNQDQLVGFVVTENIGNYSVIHFEKADTTIPGLGSKLKHDLFVALHEGGQRLLNYEQDLGIPGLREAKLSLKPAFFLRKYTIRLK